MRSNSQWYVQYASSLDYTDVKIDDQAELYFKEETMLHYSTLTQMQGGKLSFLSSDSRTTWYICQNSTITAYDSLTIESGKMACGDDYSSTIETKEAGEIVFASRAEVHIRLIANDIDVPSGDNVIITNAFITGVVNIAEESTIFIASGNVAFANVTIGPKGYFKMEGVTSFSGEIDVDILELQSSSLTMDQEYLSVSSIFMNNTALTTTTLHVADTLQIRNSNLTVNDVTVETLFKIKGYAHINGQISYTGALQIGARVTNQIEVGPISMDTSGVSSILIAYDPIPMSWDDFVPVKKDIYPFTMPFDHVPTVQDNTNGITTITTLFLNGSLPLITLSVGPCASGCVHGTCNKEQQVCECDAFYNGTRCDMAIIPLPPFNLTATPEDSKITLTWETPQQPMIVRYAIYEDDMLMQVLPEGVTMYTYTPTVPGIEYIFSVVGFNETTGFGANVTVNAIGVAVPRSLTIKELRVTMTEVSLTAINMQPTYPPLTGYEWYRNGVLISRAQSFNDTGLTNNTRYAYVVYGINALGRGKEHEEVIYTHDLPGKVDSIRQVTANWIKLEWERPYFDGNTRLLGYYVYRNGEKIAKRTVEDYEDFSVQTMYTLGGEYTYEVSAYNVEGEGAKQSLTIKLQTHYGLVVAIVMGVIGGVL